MGAKTVMTMALRNPDCCANIIPVDNAPVDAALSSDFPKYAEGMQRVEAAKPKTQKEADAILQPYAKDLPVRQFLLTNLIRPAPSEPLKFRIPVKILTDALNSMADFPFTDPDANRFGKRALFIRGTRSHYVSDETLPIVGRFFPRFELVDIEAGHWVISEKPEEFIKGMLFCVAVGRYMLMTTSCCRVLAGEGRIERVTARSHKSRPGKEVAAKSPRASAGLVHNLWPYQCGPTLVCINYVYQLLVSWVISSCAVFEPFCPLDHASLVHFTNLRFRKRPNSGCTGLLCQIWRCLLSLVAASLIGCCGKRAVDTHAHNEILPQIPKLATSIGDSAFDVPDAQILRAHFCWLEGASNMVY
jgi:hypothetical protein